MNAAIAVMLDSVATITVNARACGSAIKASRRDPYRANKAAIEQGKREMRSGMIARACLEMS
jgi:hypothetical protein